MTTPSLTVDDVEKIDDTQGFAAYGTLNDPNFGGWESYVMGYGDTREQAIADLNANALDAYAHAPQDDPEPPADPVDAPEMPSFVDFVPNLGSGLLGGNHDLLA